MDKIDSFIWIIRILFKNDFFVTVVTITYVVLTTKDLEMEGQVLLDTCAVVGVEVCNQGQQYECKDGTRKQKVRYVLVVLQLFLTHRKSMFQIRICMGHLCMKE